MSYLHFKEVLSIFGLTDGEVRLRMTWIFPYTHPEKNIYYEQIRRELQGIHICECRYNERLKGETDGTMCPTYTGLGGELEHRKIGTRLIGKSFECVMGECVI